MVSRAIWPCPSAGCSLEGISHEARQLEGQPNCGCQELLPLLGSRHSRHAAKSSQDGPSWQARSRRGASTCRGVPPLASEHPLPPRQNPVHLSRSEQSRPVARVSKIDFKTIYSHDSSCLVLNLAFSGGFRFRRTISKVQKCQFWGLVTLVAATSQSRRSERCQKWQKVAVVKWANCP